MSRFVVFLMCLTALVTAPFSAASAATVSTTPVWIGAPFAGNYRSEALPGGHGGDQVAFDYYAKPGTTVKFYAAPKDRALETKITAHIIASGAGSNNASQCGYYAVAEVRHSGNAIGRVTYSHLASKAPLGNIGRWGGTVGKTANLPLNSGNSCYKVRTPEGQHTHVEYRNYQTARPACAHSYGTRYLYGSTKLTEWAYQGYLGRYSKAPLAGNRCPSGI